jgi:phage-related protein
MTLAKAIVWLRGTVKTPPFSAAARHETGLLLRRLQQGETLPMPYSRPMTSIGARCHELRVRDERTTWRIIYRTDADAILVLDVFSKTTQRTPATVVARCRTALRRYENVRRTS